jgi:hypothetical protein
MFPSFLSNRSPALAVPCYLKSGIARMCVSVLGGGGACSQEPDGTAAKHRSGLLTKGDFRFLGFLKTT